MSRTNARAKPICHPCANAKRAIITAASKCALAKAALVELQKTDPDGFKGKVRYCRIAPGCVVDYTQRRSAVHSVVSTLSQESGIKDYTDFKWATKSKFIAHMIGEEEMTQEDREKFSFDMRNVHWPQFLDNFVQVIKRKKKKVSENNGQLCFHGSRMDQL